MCQPRLRCSGRGCGTVEESRVRQYTLPVLWLGTTYPKCRRDGHVAPAVVVAAVATEKDRRHRFVGINVIDVESHDSQSGLTRQVA